MYDIIISCPESPSIDEIEKGVRSFGFKRAPSIDGVVRLTLPLARSDGEFIELRFIRNREMIELLGLPCSRNITSQFHLIVPFRASRMEHIIAGVAAGVLALSFKGSIVAIPLDMNIQRGDQYAEWNRT